MARRFYERELDNYVRRVPRSRKRSVFSYKTVPNSAELVNNHRYW